MGASAINRLLAASPEQRRRVLRELTDAERAVIAKGVAELEAATRFTHYRENPTAFVTDLLGESIWSSQAAILDSVRDYPRTAVPASHAVSKTHTAARVAAWFVSVHPPGTALAITTAPTFRQVRNVLWPHIRRLRDRHNLPGETNLTEWKIGEELVSFGFSAAVNDEAAVQGFHAPHMLIIVDEAGGIGHALGDALEGVTTGADTKILLIGNPPTDEEQSWFEQACQSDEYNTIRIPATQSPNMTGEAVGPCRACPASVREHSLANHLVDQEWVDRQIRKFGPDSAFVEARVHARFPRGVADKVIPWSWIESALLNDNPDEGDSIRLGVDVAADGGDEFVIARADGQRVRVVHFASGEANASQVQVAGSVLQAIREAERENQGPPIRVKIDSIGIGRGTSDLLQEWGKEGKHSAVIVPVNVSERSRNSVEFGSQRSEMWWNTRQLLQPRPADGGQAVRLDVDEETAAQLSAPKYSTDSQGRVVIESKVSLKRRGVPSPDRAEAVLLALFEPPVKKGAAPALSSGSTQRNEWSL